MTGVAFTSMVVADGVWPPPWSMASMPCTELSFKCKYEASYGNVLNCCSSLGQQWFHQIV
jgi:hypothetical protein